MALQVNLSSKAISDAYQNVVAGKDIDWVVFTYEKGTKDLKVQSTGDGGLEELQEAFSNARIQYAFARVIDPNSKLPKFVQINWCGDGVPEVKKGLFHTHASAVSEFLRGTHVTINARHKSDVTPSLIMRRVLEDVSGAGYSAHNEKPRQFEPVPPVSTNDTPIGTSDMAAMRRGSPTASRPPAEPSTPTTPQPVFGTPILAPPKLWDGEPSVRPVPLPTASRTPGAPSAPRLVPTLSYTPAPRAVPLAPMPVPSSNVPITPTEEDRIALDRTAYTPIKLTPGKLRNPFQQFEAQAQQDRAQPPPRPNAGTAAGGARKLTWSERQALSKQQAGKEEQRGKGASWRSPTSTGVSATSSSRFGGQVGAAAAGGVAATWARQTETAPEVVPPPPLQPLTQLASLSIESVLEPEPQALAPAARTRPHGGQGMCAVVVYDFEAIEDNDMTLVEGETIEQIDQIDDGWWYGVGQGGAKTGLFPANYVELVEPALEPEPEQERTPVARTRSHGGRGMCAVVLYDFEAMEDNEITLVEGEMIEQIDTVDEAWWSGVGQGGAKMGLFPANHVEVVQLPEAQEVPEEKNPPPPPAKGVVAVALYDYDAVEDNDLAFREGERITEIEEAWEGWWHGMNSRGETGLFPANHVEVVGSAS